MPSRNKNFIIMPKSWPDRPDRFRRPCNVHSTAYKKRYSPHCLFANFLHCTSAKISYKNQTITIIQSKKTMTYRPRGIKLLHAIQEGKDGMSE